MTDWRDRLPAVRGKLLRDEPLAPFTWFRVGGPADVLFLPADPQDLADFLRALESGVPVTPLGVGSNVIIRDGGVEGVVVRCAGRAFGSVEVKDRLIVAGSAALDASVARASAKAGLAGLEFYAGIPGTIGGALVMNAGCYGAETKDVLRSARGVARDGTTVEVSVADLAYTYRHSGFDGEVIWTEAVFEGRPDDPDAVAARIGEITSRREQTQPIREKTGGSTFKNPPGHSSWRLVDEAGWRGRLRAETGGGAKMSELHANFMINPGEATAADLEALGEAVRADVLAKTGVQLGWEIKRLGRFSTRLEGDRT